MPEPSIRLVTPDLEQLDAALQGRAALGRALDCEVAEGWDVFPGALRSTRDAVAADPNQTRWGTRLFILDRPRRLVGWGGFKGPPRDGVVELGYAVAPGWEGRGIATAAVRELLREAFAAPEVQTVIAQPSPNRAHPRGFSRRPDSGTTARCPRSMSAQRGGSASTGRDREASPQSSRS